VVRRAPIGFVTIPSAFALNRNTPDADTHSVNADVTLEQIRAEYIVGLAGKCSSLRAAVAEAPSRGAQGAIDLAHRLRGSAGVYGFSLLSRSAGFLEDMLERGESAAEVAALLDEIEELCRLAAVPAPASQSPANGSAVERSSPVDPVS